MVIKNNEGRQKMKIGQVRGIRGLLMELTDYEFGSCYWSTCLSKKTLKRLQSFSESENFSSSENNNKITTTSLRVTYGTLLSCSPRAELFR